MLGLHYDIAIPKGYYVPLNRTPYITLWTFGTNHIYPLTDSETLHYILLYCLILGAMDTL